MEIGKFFGYTYQFSNQNVLLHICEIFNLTNLPNYLSNFDPNKAIQGV